ncbi:Maltose alpha-D-glucosyltransferase (fragment) [uncultured Stenotrophomonas sp.]|uniref:Maltose alpha-D-glucosyltransferase n=1 Tax=uncultured Stenotrophomonas sp. TaxID=165438 RepID=A0A1Y5Q8M0_9GAMM
MDSRSIVYQVDPCLFRDGDGHSWGTLGGVTEKLDHLAGLGVDALWLLPFYASGDRDGGYDVVDHCRIDPRLGDDRQFDLLVRRANALGMQVIVELVVQHTSDRHRWFRRARSSPHSRYRDYYIWERQPRRDEPQTMFPPVESGTWRRDAAAGSYYRHRFYAHEPDLEIANPRVREEIHRIMAHWLDRGILGFRVDAAPYMVERAALADPRDDGLAHAHAMERR